MLPLLNAPVKITDMKIKRALINTRPIFLKRVNTDHKAKDCLHALDFIGKDQSFDSFYAVRLLGQLPDNSLLYKDLFRHINSQLKENGVEIVDIGMALAILPLGFRL